MNELIRQAIARAIQNIRQLEKAGFTREAAIAATREASTLGPKSWAAVLGGLQ